MPDGTGSADPGKPVALARKFGMHAGLDVGFNEDTTAVYIQVGNAWFRL